MTPEEEKAKEEKKEEKEEVVEIPLKPVTREDIRRLETALLVASLFTPEVMELLKSGERLTWIDSLATAAGALAREKAGMSIKQIAEELGKTEATIRKHLKGETKAGQIILKTYERFLKEGVKIEIPFPGTIEAPEVDKLRKEIEELKKQVEQCREELNKFKEKIENIKKIIES